MICLDSYSFTAPASRTPYFAYSSSTEPVDEPVVEDEKVDVRGLYLGFFCFTFVVLLCCLYRTYQNDDEQTEDYDDYPQSLV